MITSANMDALQREVEQLRASAANGTLTKGTVDVVLDHINTMCNQAYGTPYLRTLESLYSEVEGLLDPAVRQAG